MAVLDRYALSITVTRFNITNMQMDTNVSTAHHIIVEVGMFSAVICVKLTFHLVHDYV